MQTKQDYLQLADNLIGNYPQLGVLWRARDPALLWMVESIAAMLASHSAQTEVSVMEAFEKVRDSTVLADAAMRGIVPSATPAKWLVAASNTGNTTARIEVGRMLLDADGLPWVASSVAEIPPGDSVDIEASQYRVVAFTHKVSESSPLYPVPIPESDDGSFLSGLSVSDDAGAFEYRERYTNTLPGDRVFHIEANDRKQIYVRFGVDNVAGVQPQKGETITLNVGYSHGAGAAPKQGSPFSLAYISSPTDVQLILTAKQVVALGQNPIGMDVLRDIARFPSVYDHNAVYLGEFDFLVRRKFPTLKFVNVWNERTEELARGASTENINQLFCAVVSESGLELTQDYSGSGATVIADEQLTDLQLEIRSAIEATDDSYKPLRFYPVIRFPVPVTITARVATNYVDGDAVEQIIDVLLKRFGETSAASRRRMMPSHQDIYSTLTAGIPFFRSGKTELIVQVGDIPRNIPELWTYLSRESMYVTVERMNATSPSWGY